MTTIVFITKVAVLAGVSAYLVYAAVRPRPTFLSWPMFTRITLSRFDLVDPEDAARIDHWHHFAAFDSYHDLGRVDEFLAYLRDVHGVYADGLITYVDTDGVHELEVSCGELDV